MSGAAENLAKFIGPLVLSFVYGTENRGTLVLGVMGTLSLAAAAAYCPLPRLLPRPALRKIELRSMEAYDKMQAAEFRNLPLQERVMLGVERTRLGIPQIQHGWGTYEEQLPHLPGMLQRSTDDFNFLKDQTIDRLADRAKMQQYRDNMQAFRERVAKKPGAKKEHEQEMEQMGRWLGEYFDDAGYPGWMYFPELFKAMLMTAFPPIEALDLKAGSNEASIADLEAQQINFLAVMEQHLSTKLAKDPSNPAFMKTAITSSPTAGATH